MNPDIQKRLETYVRKQILRDFEEGERILIDIWLGEKAAAPEPLQDDVDAAWTILIDTIEDCPTDSLAAAVQKAVNHLAARERREIELGIERDSVCRERDNALNRVAELETLLHLGEETILAEMAEGPVAPDSWPNPERGPAEAPDSPRPSEGEGPGVRAPEPAPERLPKINHPATDPYPIGVRESEAAPKPVAGETQKSVRESVEPAPPGDYLNTWPFEFTADQLVLAAQVLMDDHADGSLAHAKAQLPKETDPRGLRKRIWVYVDYLAVVEREPARLNARLALLAASLRRRESFAKEAKAS